MERFVFLLSVGVTLLVPNIAPTREPSKANAKRIAVKLADQEEVASAIRLLEAWIESHMSFRGLPGLSLGIVYDQDLVWSRGFGHADIEKKIPATPGTIYRIASISKLFTSTAILQLRDQGKLSLDDPVDRHLPWFKIKNPYPDARTVTIRHLLMHTSGLPRESPFPYFTDFRFPTREQIADALPKQEAVYPVETKWKYSNLGLGLAGDIVTAVSGETYESYIQKHIFDPLGMASSSVNLPDEHRARLAVGYGRRIPDEARAVRPFTDLKGLAAAGNLSSTVEDMARFASLQFRNAAAGGAQIVKGVTLREMHRVQWLMPDWKSGRGLGFHIVHREDGDLIGHGGWVAGYQSSFYFRPKDKVAVIAFFNADDGLPYPGGPDSVVDRAFKWVGSALRKATAPSAAKKETPPAWQRYVGKYRSPWGDSQVLIHDGRLLLINPTEADPIESMATLEPVAEHTFRIEGGPPSGPHGERVVFEFDKGGKVGRVKIGENYTYPQK